MKEFEKFIIFVPVFLKSNRFEEVKVQNVLYLLGFNDSFHIYVISLNIFKKKHIESQ